MSSGKLTKIRRCRWKTRIQVRAEKIKRQLKVENNFHKAMVEIKTTNDLYRASYLRWILNQMFKRFDYESGLQAISDKAAYQLWLSENKSGYKR